MKRPARLQRKRTRGWKKPEGAVCVSRPGPFGNPFRTIQDFDDWLQSGIVNVDELIERFDGTTAERLDSRRSAVLERFPELRGKDLLCWCKPGAPCHADVLLRMANP